MEPELLRLVYESIVKRETVYDGVFYTGVKTTRIVCRPSCKSRTPKIENIQLFRSVHDAALAAQVNTLIDQQLGTPLTLRSLARELTVSPSHLQRTYKRISGRSPAQQLSHARLSAAKRLLAARGMSIAEIGLAVGFRSAPHFSAWFRRMTGTTPKAYQETVTTGPGIPD